MPTDPVARSEAPSRSRRRCQEAGIGASLGPGHWLGSGRCGARLFHGTRLGQRGREGSPGGIENVVGLTATIQKSLMVGRSANIRLPRTGRRRRADFPPCAGSIAPIGICDRGVPIIAMDGAGMEDRGIATVRAALRDLAFDEGEVRGCTPLLGFESDRLMERAKHLDALAGTRHASVQGHIIRQVGEALPGVGDCMGVVNRTVARYPASRVGGIKVVGHDNLRSGASAAGEQHVQGACEHFIAGVVDDDGLGIGGAHGACNECEWPFPQRIL